MANLNMSNYRKALTAISQVIKIIQVARMEVSHEVDQSVEITILSPACTSFRITSDQGVVGQFTASAPTYKSDQRVAPFVIAGFEESIASRHNYRWMTIIRVVVGFARVERRLKDGNEAYILLKTAVTHVRRVRIVIVQNGTFAKNKRMFLLVAIYLSAWWNSSHVFVRYPWVIWHIHRCPVRIPAILHTRHARKLLNIRFIMFNLRTSFVRIFMVHSRINLRVGSL